MRFILIAILLFIGRLYADDDIILHSPEEYEDIASQNKTEIKRHTEGISPYNINLLLKFTYGFSNFNAITFKDNTIEEREYIKLYGFYMESVYKGRYGIRFEIDYAQWSSYIDNNNISNVLAPFLLGFVYHILPKSRFDIYSFIGIGFMSQSAYASEIELDTSAPFSQAEQ